MKNCPNCRCQVSDEAAFCPVCGTTLDTIHITPIQRPQEQTDQDTYIPAQPEFDPYDHTEEFDSADISSQKLTCMIVYLLNFVGVIIALLMSKESPYVQFHIRQSMKLTVLEILLSLIVLVLCWTVIVPILGAVALIVLMVLRFVAFTQVCIGKAKEPALVRSISFLK